MPDIHDLPPEVIGIVAAALEPSDFSAFRLTSKHFGAASYDELTYRVRHLRFLMVPQSLAVLRDIANDTTMAPKLDTLRLGIEYLERVENSEEFERLLTLATSDEEVLAIQAQQNKFEAYLEMQDDFWDGDDVAVLTGILSKLPNLSAVEIGQWAHSGQVNMSDCVGLATVERETGAKHTPPRDWMTSEFDVNEWDPLTHTFEAVLRALSCSRVRISTLSANMWAPPQFQCFNQVNLLYLRPMNSYYGDGLKVALSELKTLDLSISGWDEHSDGSYRQAAATTWLELLFRLTPNLETLCLTMSGWGSCLPVDSHTALIGTFLRYANLSRLQTFELRNGLVPPDDLKTFIQTHAKSLSSVTLRYLSLQGCCWSDYLSTCLAKTPNVSARLKVAWGMEDIAEDEGPWIVWTEPTGRTVFGVEKIDECRVCTSAKAQDFNMEECEHISKTFEWHELPDCYRLDTMPILREDLLWSSP